MSNPEPHALLAKTLQLLSKAATVGVCRNRMRAVVNALGSAAEHPELDPAIRATCRVLLEQWREEQARHFPVSAETAQVLH